MIKNIFENYDLVYDHTDTDFLDTEKYMRAKNGAVVNAIDKIKTKYVARELSKKRNDRYGYTQRTREVLIDSNMISKSNLCKGTFSRIMLRLLVFAKKSLVIIVLCMLFKVHQEIFTA